MTRFGVFGLLLILLVGSPSWARDIYKYRAADGSILFTDQPRDRVGPEYTLLSVRKGWNYVPRGLTAAQRDRYDAVIARAARAHNVEAALVKAVIHAESLFNRLAVSRVGAQGLMQLMPETSRHLQVLDPFDADENIDGGTRFLAYLQGRFDDLDRVLAAYNAGEGNVRRYDGIPPFAETQAYVQKVKALRLRYQVQLAARSDQDDDTLAIR
ncbi:lytic transglycosylase domain-containing protein [Alcanivorax sp. 24]|uniref:lytic transglycosylase domain-containing protein n=1 Tax=Alcanivorax sp. 24 TaxID=2545266 RepID=UPI00105C9FE3|nr:lytic transglycosylase domain-containing protein [Alcanivorax sp. 24]